jgi:mannitol 2-dehydrogenase
VTALNQDNLEIIGKEVPSPTYDRSRIRTGIVHFGVGGFHRAHQAAYVDELLTLGQGDEWGITGVGVLPQDRHMAEVMAAQDCLYTLVLKHPDGSRHARVVGSIVDVKFAPEDPEAVLAVMVDPAVRIVSLTVTEGGYYVSQSTGEFEPDAALIADLEPGALPGTAFGFVVEALARRRAQGTPPFAVMSCDNVQGNGDVARQMIGEFARRKDPDLGAWISEHVSFPNSMVDRITPATTDEDRAELAREHDIEDGWPVVCEPFTQWVLEDRFPTGRPPYEDAGVQMVDDVEPYELMKLRLLNASHQALGYLGHLVGYRYVDEACRDPLFVKFLLGYMREEALPTLAPVPGVDLDSYCEQLIERFANAGIRDTIARLCTDSSDRIPKFLVPVVTHQLSVGGPFRRSTLVIASWARYAEGVDEVGASIDVRDRRSDELMARAKRQGEEPLAFLEDRSLFGDLRDDARFTAEYTAALRSLHGHGARATLAALEGAS